MEDRYQDKLRSVAEYLLVRRERVKREKERDGWRGGKEGVARQGKGGETRRGEKERMEGENEGEIEKGGGFPPRPRLPPPPPPDGRRHPFPPPHERFSGLTVARLRGPGGREREKRER